MCQPLSSQTPPTSALEPETSSADESVEGLDRHSVNSALCRALFLRTEAREARMQSLVDSLLLPDIRERRIEAVEPGRLHLSLSPSPLFPYRDRAAWLAECWKTLAVDLREHFQEFASPQCVIRGASQNPPPELRAVGAYLGRFGGLKLRACQVTLDFEGLSQQRLFLEVHTGDERIDHDLERFERVLGNIAGQPVIIRTLDLHRAELQERVARGLEQRDGFRRPRCFGVQDDPQPKVHRVPIDLRALEWIGLDPERTKRPEDLIALRHTHRGAYILTAFPLHIGGDAFQGTAQTAPVIFCGGILSPDGSIARMRLGLGTISRPQLLTHESFRERSTELTNALTEALRPFVREENSERGPWATERIVHVAMQLAQHIVIRCMQRRAAEMLFVARSSRLFESARVLRGSDLDPEQHWLDLKVGRPGALLNQRQIRTLVLGRPPLPNEAFEQFGELRSGLPPAG